MTLSMAEDKCKRMSARLPTVHSMEDAKELASIIGPSSYVWLGARRKKDAVTRFDYEWTDGSSFNFSDWQLTNTPCSISTPCCALSLYANSGQGFLFDEPCSVSNRVICIFNMTISEWFNNHNSISQIDERERNAALEKLNETFVQMSGHLKDEFNRLEDQFIRSLEILNTSLYNKEGQMEQMESNFSAATAQVTANLEQQKSLIDKLNQTLATIQVTEYVDARVDHLKDSLTESFRRLNSSLIYKLAGLRSEVSNLTIKTHFKMETMKMDISSLHSWFNVFAGLLVTLVFFVLLMIFFKLDLLSCGTRKRDTRVPRTVGQTNNTARTRLNNLETTGPQNASSFDMFGEEVNILSSENSDEASLQEDQFFPFAPTKN